MDEVNIISEGIAILILATIGISINKFAQANEWLSLLPENVTRAMFVYIAGMIICDKKATSKKIAEKAGFCSHDTLTKALIRCKPIVKTLSILLIKFCLSQTNGYLIIDDVLVPKKYAINIQGVYEDYDHAENEMVKGMRIVMILWSNGQIRIPIAWTIWHKEDKEFLGYTSKGKAKYKHTGLCLMKIDGEKATYQTKNELAMDMLKNVLAQGLKVEYITFDSWYASKENLVSITNSSFAISAECYSRLKSNCQVFYEDRKMSVGEVDRLFTTASFNHKHGAYIKAVDVYLPQYGDIKLLLVRHDTHSEPDKTKYLFSTDINADATQILLLYRSRWAIESIFRDLKQELNLGSCQSVSLDAQKSHLALSIFAFVLMELIPVLEFQGKKYQTIGEKKRLLSRLSLFTNLSKTRYWLIDNSQPGSSFLALDQLKLDKVELSFGFAYKTLLFSNFQRSA